MTDETALRLVAAAGGLVLVVSTAVWSILTEAANSNGIEAQEIVGWVVGVFGSGGLAWKVWSDRSATTRADKVQEARLTDIKAERDKAIADRDYWRAMAIGAGEKPEQD